MHGVESTHNVTQPRTIDYAQRPMLVFWEVTRSCLLACHHCRASATRNPLPGELNHLEGKDLIDQIAGFGRPFPILVLTGGDCLLRADIFELAEYAISKGIPVAMSPSVTPMLTDEAMKRMVSIGVKAVSLSLDGANAETHDSVRGIPGHFDETLPAIRALVDAGLTVQINTTVMSRNLDQLPRIAQIVKESGAHIWEVFFLIQVGRGETTDSITPEEHEAVCHFLVDASKYGFIIRTVEAPFFRRVVAERRLDDQKRPSSETYSYLRFKLIELMGEGEKKSSAHTAATRDGKGILFVAHDGEVYPAGFLPLGLGSVRSQPLAEIYRENRILTDIRASKFAGRCGACEYSDLCGGSRARAYATDGDPLGEDPACPYIPSNFHQQELVDL